MKNMAVYDNPFFYNNVYGHALELLTRNPRLLPAGCVHLDLGCGFGRIAEPLVQKTGLHYIGVDGCEVGLQSLAQRGFESHALWLRGEDKTYDRLNAIIAGRVVASITFLDILEHLSDSDQILRAVARLAREHTAYVVLSAPNVAHGDIGRKLAFGVWDYTETGLLDHTHMRFFDNKLFGKSLAKAGLHVVDSHDIELPLSDQHFPVDHPALSDTTHLGLLLHKLRSQIDPFEHVNQFVRLCVAGPCVDAPTYLVEREEARPFLSVVTRTQGTRMHTFTETLTCFAGQTDTDFEVLVMGHCLPPERQLAVEHAIDDSPAWLRDRIRLILVNKGNRTHPLNVGFENARGHYIIILDDDDIPFANWVENFREIASKEPGKILRAATVRQDVKTANVGGLAGLRAEGPLERIYPSSFDLLQHLRANQTPPPCLAFPRGAFHDLNIRFDEELTTTEDWDFLLRVAAVVGVANAPQITSVYRWWVSEDCARFVHPPEEWRANYEKILHKIDGMMFLFPEGTTRKIRYLLDHFVDQLPPSPGSAARGNKSTVNLTVLRYPRRMLKWIRYTRKRRIYRSELKIIRKSPLFDRNWYLEMYPDVAEAGIDPALHYILSGACEGRHPGPNFDSTEYLRCNSDVGAAGVNPLVHYMRWGRSEGRPIYKLDQ